MTNTAALAPITLSRKQAAALWISAQRFSDPMFGSGADAVHAAVSHLGYVQIDTINVIERCHHHILFNRIPSYTQHDLVLAQSEQKSVFEYWTHALAYLPIEAFPFFVRQMKTHLKEPTGWGGQTTPYQLRKVLRRIRHDGPLAIADFNDGRRLDKAHLWASTKPAKFALEAGFYAGRLVIAKRRGIEKLYELTERHFGWDRLPKPATDLQRKNYEIDRALRAQGFVSLDSICHNHPARKADIAPLIDRRVRRKTLIEVRIDGEDRWRHFIPPALLDAANPECAEQRAHILSPFDPLLIQRRRTHFLLGHNHLFEAYVPAKKRKWGYFTLPVLVGDRIVAGLDLKANRTKRRLDINNWLWFDGADPARHKPMIENALDEFDGFQFQAE